MSDLWHQGPKLIMDILGESRGTQLVPTNEIWDDYFDVDSDLFTDANPSLPTYQLTSVDNQITVSRPVVVHDHQGTLDIPELSERESIGNDFIMFRRTGTDSFDYQVFFEGEDDRVEELDLFINQNGFLTGHRRRAYIYPTP
jgi:hypothetical protein